MKSFNCDQKMGDLTVGTEYNGGINLGRWRISGWEVLNKCCVVLKRHNSSSDLMYQPIII